MEYSKKNTYHQSCQSKMAANYGQRIVLGIKSINMPFLILPLLHQNEQVLGPMSVNSK